MRLVIITSDSDGKVGLVSERVFADAAEATRELASLFAKGEADSSAAFYTVDMDSAVPVIVLQPAIMPQEVPAAEEPPAEAEETVPDEVETSIADEIVAEAEEEQTEAEAAPEVEAPAPPAEAADAEGSEPDAAPQWPWDLPVVVPEGAVDEAEEAATTATEEPEAGADGPEPEEEEEAAEEQPAEDLAVDEAPAVEDEVVAETGEVEGDSDVEASPEPLLEPVVDLEEEPQGAEPVEEAAAIELPDEPVSIEFIEAAEPVEVGLPAEDPFGMGDLDVPAAEIIESFNADDAEVVDRVAEPQSVLEMTVTEDDSASAVEDAPASSERVYEPGALNMSEYTCDDCVYVNTCPNQHQKKPAECGSFQWRSV